MKLQTLLGLTGVDIEPALVNLPAVHHNHLSVGTLRVDGALDLIATLNLGGRALTPERKSTVMRLLQLIGEAVASNDRHALRIFSCKDAPCTICNAVDEATDQTA